MENDDCLTQEAEPPSQELEPPGSTAVLETITWGDLFKDLAPSQPSLFLTPPEETAVSAHKARGPASFKTSPRSRQFPTDRIATRWLCCQSAATRSLQVEIP